MAANDCIYCQICVCECLRLQRVSVAEYVSAFLGPVFIEQIDSLHDVAIFVFGGFYFRALVGNLISNCLKC
jgi:hypothetical protein